MKASGAHGGRWAGAPEVPSPIARLLQSGETDEPSSIVMSQRLQAHRSEMHVRPPSVVGRRRLLCGGTGRCGPPRGPPGPCSPHRFSCTDGWCTTHKTSHSSLLTCTRCETRAQPHRPPRRHPCFPVAAQEPYFKSRSLQQGAKARPGDGTEVAQLRKQSAAMSRDFERLLGAHERQEAAVVDLRQKVLLRLLHCCGCDADADAAAAATICGSSKSFV